VACLESFINRSPSPIRSTAAPSFTLHSPVPRRRPAPSSAFAQWVRVVLVISSSPQSTNGLKQTPQGTDGYSSDHPDNGAGSDVMQDVAPSICGVVRVV
jgi:hypothetical protein